jgi:hypothetical protein
MMHRNVTLLFLLTAIASIAATADTPSTAPALTDVTFHVLAVPHTVLQKDFSACAFTMKVLLYISANTQSKYLAARCKSFLLFRGLQHL